MTKQSLRDLLTDYYADKSLPESTVERLKASVQTEHTLKEDPMENGHARAWWTNPLSWLAASFGVLLVITVGYVSSQAWNPGGAPEPKLDAGLPNLVAVKVHAEWCRRSPVVAPIFKDFTDKYGNEPVLFVDLDITDTTTRQQARYLASDLGIEWVFDQPFESGMIKLLDRERGTVVATLTATDEVPQMDGLLARALGVNHSPHGGASN